MSQFLKVKSVDEVLEILRGLEPLDDEETGLDAACGRVTAQDIRAPEPLPHFARSVMDGYAVKARDTFGASETLPALLEVSGEILMGKPADGKLEAGKAMAIPTGGMLPGGADAVAMVEYTASVDEHTIEVNRPVAPGDNVLGVGEDIPGGAVLFAAGRRLRPQDIGVLAALGIPSVRVRRVPRVAILSTGDEIVPVTTHPVPDGKIRDINSFTLAAQVRQAGGIVGMSAVVGDDLNELASVCAAALENHDVLLLSGGSSVGARDFTVRVLERLPDSRLLVHGVAIRPGKPTILGLVGGKVFWGLPGQPVSSMMVSRAFVLPTLDILQGVTGGGAGEGGTCRAVLGRKIPSVHGRTDYFPVTVSRVGDETVAIPTFGKSAMISVLARADGYVIVPEHVEGIDGGSAVEVHLFSRWNG